jgi:serine/threonine protein kinase
MYCTSHKFQTFSHIGVFFLEVHEVPVLAQEEMAAETEILRILGYCPYIVNMLGSGTKGENMYIITEYADLGNLQDFLRSERETVRQFISDTHV